MRAPRTRTDIRQDQIARTALAVISRHGFHRTSIARVARDVGVVPSAIYRHYRSKDEVLDAVLDLIADRLLANVAAVRAETPDAPERLRRLLMRHARMVREEVPIPRVVFSEQIFTGHARRRDRVHRMFRDYLDGIAGIVREGQRDGMLRAGLPAPTLAVMFLGLVQPAAILFVLSDGAFDVVKHAREAWKVFAGVVAPESRARRPAPRGRTPRPTHS